jgi:hypothetical protein
MDKRLDNFTEQKNVFDYELNEILREQEDAYDIAYTNSILEKFPYLKEPSGSRPNFNQFEKIWNNYYNLIPCNEFEKYMKIINKIRNNIIIFVEDKKIFIELIENISETIYRTKYYEKDDNNDYDEENTYKDVEIKCCHDIKKYLKSQI